MSSSLKASAQELLQNFVSAQEADGEHVAVDVLRILQEEAQLLYETECVKDLLGQDPFKCYEDKQVRRKIDRLKEYLQVTSCFRLEKDDDYCLTEAVVKCSNNIPLHSPLHKKQKRQSQAETSITQLHFRYERNPSTETSATSIWYSIDLSQNYGPKQNILTIRLWADGNKPSRLPAVSIDEAGDDDCWEDTDSEEEQEGKPASKTQKEGPSKSKKLEGSSAKKNGEKNCSKEDDEGNENKEEDSPRDRFACFVDPDVLLSFQEATQLTSLDQATAFFTLMAFPYYQHEWDLVGFVLDSVFGYNDDEEEDGAEEDDDDK